MQQLREFTAAELGAALIKEYPQLNPDWVRNQATHACSEAERRSVLLRLPQTKPIRYRWWDLSTVSTVTTAAPSHTTPPAPPSTNAPPPPTH